MIPLAAIQALPWRLIGAVAALVAIGVLGWRVSVWHRAYEALPGVEDALKAEEQCEPETKCAERVAALVERQRVVSEEVVRGYQQEVESLRNRPVRTRTVRVCNDGGLPDASPAEGTGQGPAASGVVHSGTGSDIGPGLYALAQRADELSAQCRAIILRDRALAALPEK